MEFGEYPFLVKKQEGGSFAVEPQFRANAEECAVNEVFPAERLEIMKARALAYGYKLEEKQDESRPL